MTNLNHEMMNIEEVAQYLKMSERAIYDWVKSGKIPAFKLGNTWRFKKSEIIGWMESNRTGPTPTKFPVSDIQSMTNQHIDKENQINLFTNKVEIEMSRRPDGILSFEIFEQQFNKEVIKEGLKRLKEFGYELHQTQSTKQKFIKRS